jgi:YebC/PmpR family DNA-binding regulatory protein
MSGHSKWSTIKHQKGAADAKRSSVFTKLANSITVIAREGGGDPESNFRLRLAIEKARQANMPKDNIERAIKRGTGELGGATFENIMYEAYAPGGVALMIEVNTDNRNRSVSAIKSILTKAYAKLAEAGAVAYLFEQKGSMHVRGGEEAELVIIESGADDYELVEENAYRVVTLPKDTMAVAKSLQDAGLGVEEVGLSLEPTATITINDEQTARQLVRLVEQLEDIDDVAAVYANFNLAENLNLA